MNISEAERRELEANGGIARTEGPDANGITTYYAPNGYFVRIDADGNPRMRGSGPSQQVSGEQPAAAPPRGVGMTQQELEALLAQMGTLGAGDFREETKTEDIPNPKYDATDPSNNQPNIKAPVTYRTWIQPGTNRRLTVKVNADGSYTKVFDGADPQINPSRGAGSGSTEWHTEGRPDPSKPGGYDNSRPIMVRTVNGVRETREPTGKELQDWNEAQQITRNGGKTDAEVRADADRNRPKPEPDGRGGWGYWDTTKTPPQWTPITTGGPAGEQPKPVEINGKWGVWKPGPDGVPVWTPVNAPPEQRAPAETGSFIPDRTKPALGLVEHVQRLAQLRAQGKLTDKQYNEAIATAEAMAAAEGKRLDAQISAQQTAASHAITQRGQDISASTARLGQANAATREAFDQGTKWASAMTPSSYKAAGGPLYSAVMVAQDARAGNWGGMYQPPQVTTAGYPAWDSLVRADPNPSGAYVASQNAAITGQAGALLQGAATPPPPAAPAAPLPAPLIRPNAPVISPPPTAGEPGGPPLAPGPVYGGPSTPNPATPNLYPPPPSPPAQQPAMPQPLLPPSPTTPNLYPNPTNGGWDEPTPPPPAGAPTWDTYRPPPISSPAGGNVQLAPFTAPAFGAMDPRISRVMGNVPQGMDPNEWANYVMEAARLEGVA